MEVEPLEEGRMQITTVGEQRFRILSLIYDLPYLVGMVEFHPIVVESPEELISAADKLTPKVRQYINLLKQIEAVDLDPDSLPQDPVMLGHLAPVLLQMPPIEKQDLLISESALELLLSTNRIYSREIAFLRAIITRSKDQSQSPVSQN
jgi:Lon protease-like protein